MPPQRRSPCTVEPESPAGVSFSTVAQALRACNRGEVAHHADTIASRFPGIPAPAATTCRRPSRPGPDCHRVELLHAGFVRSAQSCACCASCVCCATASDRRCGNRWKTNFHLDRFGSDSNRPSHRPPRAEQSAHDCQMPLLTARMPPLLPEIVVVALLGGVHLAVGLGQKLFGIKSVDRIKRGSQAQR